MGNCVHFAYCRIFNKDRERFICFNPGYCMDNVCEEYIPSGHSNKKVKPFKPSQDMIEKEMKKKKAKRKNRRKRK